MPQDVNNFGVTTSDTPLPLPSIAGRSGPQKAEAPCHVIEREAHLCKGALCLIRANALAVPDDE